MLGTELTVRVEKACLGPHCRCARHGNLCSARGMTGVQRAREVGLGQAGERAGSTMGGDGRARAKTPGRDLSTIVSTIFSSIYNANARPFLSLALCQIVLAVSPPCPPPSSTELARNVLVRDAYSKLDSLGADLSGRAACVADPGSHLRGVWLELVRDGRVGRRGEERSGAVRGHPLAEY